MRKLALRATYGDLASFDYESLVESLQEEGHLYDDWSDLLLEVVSLPNFGDIRQGDRILLDGDDEWRYVANTAVIPSIYAPRVAIVLDDYSLTIGDDCDTFEVDDVLPLYVLRDNRDLMRPQYIPDMDIDHALKTCQKETMLYVELLRLKADRATQDKEEK